MSSRLTILTNNLHEEQFAYRTKLLVGLSIFFIAFFVLSMSFYLGTLTHAAVDSMYKVQSESVNSESESITWQGPEQGIYYGLNTNYGSFAIAGGSATNDSNAEPQLHIMLTGLQPGTTYHYKIGIYGTDHSFRTISATQ